MQYNFTFTKTTEGMQKPQCMFCNTEFSNAYLKPFELQDHYKTEMVEQMFQVMMLNP